MSELPNAVTMPQMESEIIASGIKVTRPRLALRARSCDTPSHTRLASNAHTQPGVPRRTGPSICGWAIRTGTCMVCSRVERVEGSEKAKLRPHVVADEALRQQREAARQHAGAEVEALHDRAVPGDVAAREVVEGPEQREKGQRDQQVDRREASDVGDPDGVADEDGRP